MVSEIMIFHQSMKRFLIVSILISFSLVGSKERMNTACAYATYDSINLHKSTRLESGTFSNLFNFKGNGDKENA